MRKKFVLPKPIELSPFLEDKLAKEERQRQRRERREQKAAEKVQRDREAMRIAEIRRDEAELYERDYKASIEATNEKIARVWNMVNDLEEIIELRQAGPYKKRKSLVNKLSNMLDQMLKQTMKLEEIKETWMMKIENKAKWVEKREEEKRRRLSRRNGNEHS